MHRIQRFILAQLTEHDSLRYTDMRPPFMEASQFMYHLRLLIKGGLVIKTPVGMYALSAAGKRYVDRADDSSLQLRQQPRIAAMIICKHPEYGILYAQRSVQPAVKRIGFPLIDIPLGYQAPLQEFITNEVKGRLALELSLEHRADGYINLYKEGELEGSLLAHVFFGEDPSGVLKRSDSEFDYFWQKEATEQSSVLLSVVHILNLLEKHNEFFFFEYEFDLNEGSIPL